MTLARAGAWPEVVELLANVVTHARTHGELRVLYGEALTRTGRERDARAWLETLVPLLEREGDHRGHRQALNLLGVASFTLGDLDAAGAAFAAALELASRHDDLLLVARATNNLGTIANVQGRHDAALGHYRVALPTYQRLGQRRGLAESHHNMAITYRDLAALEEADEHELRAIEYAADGVAPRVAAMGRIGRAELALRRGDARFAAGTARRAAGELQQLHDPLNEADAHRLVGAASAELGEFDAAFVGFDAALRIAEERGHALVRAETLRDRAYAERLHGDESHARGDAESAIALFEQLGSTVEVLRLRQRFPRAGA